MKMKNLSMFALIALVVVFSACSVTKRQYAPGYHVEFKKFGKVENVAEVKKEKVAKSVVATEEVAVVSNEVVAPVAIAPVASVVANEEVAVVVAPVAEKNVVKAVAAKMAEFRSNNTVVENNEASIEAAHSNGFKPEWYHIAMAICFLFPTFMFWKAIIQKNDIPWKEAIIGSLLYLLCYVPGIIYCIKWAKREF
jgi:uncharacterized membrane protein YqaE (UPF0057 family)/uncharacterized protein YcgI (DUF1989 family)